MVAIAAASVSVAVAQTAATCSRPENNLVAAVYNFVPERSLPADDRRQVLKSESAFVRTLRQDPELVTQDLTTPVADDAGKQLPDITDRMLPPPAETGATFSINGKVTKAGTGFTLTTDLRRPSDNAVLNEVTTPFASASDSDTAGRAAALRMLQFIAGQAGASQGPRPSGSLIGPQIILQIAKDRLRVNEAEPGKVILMDCDGTRLKEREFTSAARLDQGQTLLAQSSGTRTTDANGEYSGTISSKVPGVFTQVVTLKYTDTLGSPREVNAAKSVAIYSDGETWQMSVTVKHLTRVRYLREDFDSKRTDILTSLDVKKSNMMFLFKTETSPEGEAGTDVINAFNGFGEASYREGEVSYGDRWHTIFGSGLVDQSPDAAKHISASFSVSPQNKEFQFSLSGLTFRGQRFNNTCTRDTGCKSTEDAFVVSDGINGGGAITPEMTRSGVYTYKHTEKKMLDEGLKKNELGSEDRSGSYEINEIDVKISRIGTTSKR